MRGMTTRTPEGRFAPDLASLHPAPDALRVIVAHELARRREHLLAGPRSVVDLARAAGVSEATLKQQLSGRRPLSRVVGEAVEAALGLGAPLESLLESLRQ